MFFRRGARTDRWLDLRIAIFTAGALIAVVGIALRLDWIVWLAVAILAAGMLLRLVARSQGSRDDHPSD